MTRLQLVKAIRSRQNGPGFERACSICWFISVSRVEARRGIGGAIDGQRRFRDGADGFHPAIARSPCDWRNASARPRRESAHDSGLNRKSNWSEIAGARRIGEAFQFAIELFLMIGAMGGDSSGECGDGGGRGLHFPAQHIERFAGGALIIPKLAAKTGADAAQFLVQAGSLPTLAQRFHFSAKKRCLRGIHFDGVVGGRLNGEAVAIRQEMAQASPNGPVHRSICGSRSQSCLLDRSSAGGTLV